MCLRMSLSFNLLPNLGSIPTWASPATSPGCIPIFFSDFTSIVNDNVDNLIAKELLWLSASSTSSVWQQNCLHAAPLLWYQKARLKHHSRSNGKIFFSHILGVPSETLIWKKVVCDRVLFEFRMQALYVLCTQRSICLPLIYASPSPVQ